MRQSRINFRNLNLLLIFLLPVLFLIFGIKKQNEIHEKLMVQGIGIDFDDKSKYKVTVQAHDFKNSESKNEPKIRIIETFGETVSEALENLKSITGLYPLYSQNKIIILGETIAKRGVKSVIDFFSRYYENRPSVKLRVAQGVASDILNFKVEDKLVKSSEIRDLVDEQSDINVLEFEKNENESLDSIVMTVEKGDNGLLKSENGSIIHNNKLSKILNADEMLGVKILKSNSRVGIFNFYINENIVSCKLEDAKTKIKVSLEDNIPNIYVSTKVNSSLLETDQRFDDINEMEQNITSKLQEELKNICNKAISNLICNGYDTIKLRKKIKNKYPEYYKKNKSIWKNQILPDIKYKTDIEVKLSMVGTKKS